MKALLAVDPSKNSAGVAYFVDGVLLEAARITVPRSVKLARGAAAEDMARRIFAWYSGACDTLVYEWPKVYRGAKSKCDPRDLLHLVGVGAALAHRVEASEIVTPEPGEWSLGTSKTDPETGRPFKDPWISSRGRRVTSRLSAAERAVVPDSHDAIDAVGMGLWYLGRFEPLRVMPGAV